MEYKDFSFEFGDTGVYKEYSGTNASILAIRNILLSRPGNFPFTPSLGMDIARYQFELLDSATIDDIKRQLLLQIGKFLPAIENVNVNVMKVEEDVNGELVTGIGINISAIDNSNTISANYLVLKNNGVVSVYNEVSN